jgi:sortase A
LPNPDNAPADPYAPEPLVEVGAIEIPALGVIKPMFEGITLTTLDHGPGHWPGSAMPGQQGNVVVAGHRVSHDKPFRYIDRLVAGDDVIFTTGGNRFVYKVTSTEIVQPDALWIVNQSPDYTATLFACHPAGSTRQRIVVHLSYAPDG